MYKMMIVDDQVKEINGIKGLIAWDQADIEIIGEATNGRIGYEKALLLKPDIIITDIVMPVMDGLEMIQKIKEVLPNIKVIFISCFDDFKFVGQAINQGAYGYVLKPLLPGELMNAINKTLGRCEEEKKNLELVLLKKKIDESIASLRELFFRNLLLGVFAEEVDIYEQSRFLDLQMNGMLFCVVNIEIEYYEGERAYFHAVTLIEKLKLQFNAQNDIHFILLDLLHITVLFIKQCDQPLRAKREIIEKSEEILDFINSVFSFTATLGMGSVTDKLTEVTNSYKEARSTLQYKFYLGKQRVIDSEEVNFSFDTQTSNFEDLNEPLKCLLLSSDQTLVNPFVERFLPVHKSPDKLKYICFTLTNALQLQLLQMQHSLENIFGSFSHIIQQISVLESYQDIKNLMFNMLSAAIDYIKNSNKIENVDIVRKMEQYIIKNFQSAIVIDDIASHVYLSPGYANYIFKSLTGKTIHQFIEDVRMDNATQMLLSMKDVKVYLIAEKVGYNNSAYFINVFRKIYGCTPIEYRKRTIL